MRFGLRRNIAYRTDSTDRGPNGIIVADLASGTAWRRLHDHPYTKAQQPPAVLPIDAGPVRLV